jgi:hypothetical protein
MQLIVATNNTAIVATSDDGFTDLIGKRALRRRHQSSEKGRPGMVEEEVGKGKAMGTGSGHGTPSGTKDLKEEIGETVREGDTPSPANRGPATRGRRCQKRATWAEVVVAGGANIPTVFNLKKKNSIYLDSPSVTMAKECTGALEIEAGQALRRMQGLRRNQSIRRKHQVEEWKVEGAIEYFLFISFVRRLWGKEKGGPHLMALLYLYDLDGGQE